MSTPNGPLVRLILTVAHVRGAFPNLRFLFESSALQVAHMGSGFKVKGQEYICLQVTQLLPHAL